MTPHQQAGLLHELHVFSISCFILITAFCRLLKPNGKLCLSGLTYGKGPLGWLATGMMIALSCPPLALSFHGLTGYLLFDDHVSKMLS